MHRPGYHKRLVAQLHIIMDEAAVEYDQDEDVVDDFAQYVKDWASRRAENRQPQQIIYNIYPLYTRRV